MNNVMPFTNKEDIQEQACIWISRIDRGLSDSERKDLKGWAGKSRAHQQILFEVAELWDDLSALNELSGLFPLRANSAQRRVWSPSVRWSVAASLMVAVLFTSTWLVSQNMRSNQPHLVLQSNVYETKLGEQRPVSLADGSIIHLNTDSLVQVDYGEHARRIELVRGEAHFDVAHNPSKPFVVSVAGKTVTAVGTAFNIQITDNALFEVLVTEGKILVQEALSVTQNSAAETKLAGQTYMSAGDKAAFLGQQQEPIVQLTLDQVQKDLAWQQGMLVFQGDILLDALEEVSRYSHVEFVIQDEEIEKTRVAGYFKVGDIVGLLATLENNFSIQYEQIGEQRYRLFAAQQ